MEVLKESNILTMAGDYTNATIHPLSKEEKKIWRDFDARKASFSEIRSKAETWVTVTAGLTTAFGIGSVLTSVDSLRYIQLGWRICYAVLLLFGLGFLVASAVYIFPDFDLALAPATSEEAEEMVDEGKKDEMILKEAALFRLSKSFTLVGFVLIAIASVVSWFAPRDISDCQ